MATYREIGLLVNRRGEAQRAWPLPHLARRLAREQETDATFRRYAWQIVSENDTSSAKSA